MLNSSGKSQHLPSTFFSVSEDISGDYIWDILGGHVNSYWYYAHILIHNPILQKVFALISILLKHPGKIDLIYSYA